MADDTNRGLTKFLRELTEEHPEHTDIDTLTALAQEQFPSATRQSVYSALHQVKRKRERDAAAAGLPEIMCLQDVSLRLYRTENQLELFQDDDGILVVVPIKLTEAQAAQVQQWIWMRQN